MFRMLFLLIAAGLATPALAQDNAAAPAAEQNASPIRERAPLAGRKLACKQAAVGKKLRGDEARDDMALCIAEAQVDCLKQAIAQKARGPERKTFMQSCMARTS